MNYISNIFRKINKSTDSEQNGSKSNRIDSNLSYVYHEKQVKELCALHTLNNLFQEKTFTKAFLDDICIQ